MTCSNCGLVISYKPMEEYIDSVKNKYKILCKSIYQREYHIKNILLDISAKSEITISHQETQKIIEIFKILPIIFKERKRMPNIQFIFKKILQLLNNNNWMHIKTSKNEDYMRMLNDYWSLIILQIGNEINLIIKSEN